MEFIVIENVDLIVIGGGIHGCGVAADAAGRGLKVALFEQYDLGSQTSNASTKLIHGGLRYLETGQYRLVYNCLQEQKLLMKQACHLISPMKFVIPMDLSVRPQWMVKLGLFIYDLFRFEGLPKSEILDHSQRESLNWAEPPKGAFFYYDCITDDHRLVISDALIAQSLGAKIHTYTQIDTVISTEDGWIVRSEKNDVKWTTRAKALVLLAGPWIQEAFMKYHLPFPQPKVSFVQGSHLVLPRIYEGEHAIAYQHKDRRLVFFVPYQDRWTLIGTTDCPVSGAEKHPSVTAQERTYLLDVVNKAFGTTFTKKDIVSEFAGMRCLEEAPDAGPQTSRESHVLSYKCPTYGHAFVSLIGGKISAWRLTAEHIVDCLKSTFPSMAKAWTQNKTCAGGKENITLDQMIHHLSYEYPWVPGATLARFAKLYGLRTKNLLKDCTTWDDMGSYIVKDLTEKEVQFLMTTEWACSFEDILDRRTRLGLGLPTAERRKGYTRFVKLCNKWELNQEQTV